MSTPFDRVPAGSGLHPVMMVAIAARDLAASVAFYRTLFGWQAHAVSPDIAVVSLPQGPAVVLRADAPEGFQGMVPFIRVDDVAATIASVVAAGATIETAPWSAPMGGTLARIADPSGTLYGLVDAALPPGLARMPMPFGANPRPPAGTICSLEMYARDSASAAGFFGVHFGWGTVETIPQYLAFDPGAGVPGVFQSHTPGLPAVAYVYVGDATATLARAEAAGGQRIGEPMALPGLGTFGYFKDACGTTMGLIAP